MVFEMVYALVDSIVYWFWASMVLIVAISVLGYLIPQLIQIYVLKPQNLRTKYGAEWAVVTGGSSGIGRSVVEKLAQQRLNVAIVALPDKLLTSAVEELRKKYPGVEFREIGVDLASPTYMDDVAKATSDIVVQVVFSNAGYMAVGLFADTPLPSLMKNYHVNSTAAVPLAHHFSREMIRHRKRGCIVFTSSPAGLMPTPYSVVYGATKAFVTEFGATLAAELRADGIDVLVVHPSPTDTNFYNNDTANKSGALQFFKRTANSPDVVADTALASVGRFGGVVRDQGYFSLALKLLMRVVDFNVLAQVITIFTPMDGTFKKLHKERKLD